MPKTEPRGGQVRDGTLGRADLDTTTAGQAVATKIIAGTNITLQSSGVDSGTGDVTINSAGGGGNTVTATSSAGNTTTVVHNLNTRYIHVSVVRATTPYDAIDGVYLTATDANTIDIDFSDLGGATSGQYLILITASTSTVSVNVTPIPLEQGYNDDGDKSGAVTVALSTGNVHRIRLTGNITSMTVTGATAGRASSLTLIMVQDGTGGRTSAWPSGTKWDGAAPVLSTGIDKIDIVTLFSVDGGTTWYGSLVGKDFA